MESTRGLDINISMQIHGSFMRLRNTYTRAKDLCGISLYMRNVDTTENVNELAMATRTGMITICVKTLLGGREKNNIVKKKKQKENKDTDEF